MQLGYASLELPDVMRLLDFRLSGGDAVRAAERLLPGHQPQQRPPAAVHLHPIPAQVKAGRSARHRRHTAAHRRGHGSPQAGPGRDQRRFQPVQLRAGGCARERWGLQGSGLTGSTLNVPSGSM